MSEKEIIIINDEPFYRILNGTSYDYAPMPKAFKPYFERLQKEKEDLQQEITKLKGVIETYEIIIKSTNVLNWHELKEWLEEEITDQKEHFRFICEHYNQEVPDIIIQLEKTDLLIRKLESILSKMQELENRK